MMAMTNRAALKPLLLLLLTLSSLVSSRRLLSIDGPQFLNSTHANDTRPTPTTGPGTHSTTATHVVHVTQSTEVKEKKSVGGSTAAQHALETATNQSSVGTEIVGTFHPSKGTERNTPHQVTGTESPAGTESPHLTKAPGTNGSSGLTSLPGSSSHTTQPRGVTSKEATTSVVAVVTATNRGPTLRTTSLPSTTKQQTPTTTITKTSTTTSTTKKGHICPTDAPKREGLLGPCLIAIALLAVLVIIFIMSTVVLATKLAASRLRNREGLLQDTEMVCISALMNDTEHPIPKPRHPKSNGALIPSTEDEDGDDLTLNSFLPDTEIH